MAPRLPKVSRFSGNWRRPLTSIYNDNYLFGFNFYDDMMLWLDKRDVGVDPGPVVTLPSVPETQFKKFARERDERAFRKDEEAAVRRTQARIEKMAPRPHGLRSEREDLTRAALLRSDSYSSFSKSAIADIDTALALQRHRSSSANAYFRKPLRTERDYDQWLKQIDKRRHRRMMEKDFESEYLETPRRSMLRNFDYDLARQRDEILLNEKLRRSGSPPPSSFFADRYRQRSMSPVRDIFTSDTSSRFRHSSYLRESGFSSAPGSRAGSPVRGLGGYDNYMSTAATPSSWEMKCKHMQSEIEALNHRLMDAEGKLKSEVPRVKSTYQRQIEELESRLESANRNNMDLQKKIQTKYVD